MAGPTPSLTDTLVHTAVCPTPPLPLTLSPSTGHLLQLFLLWPAHLASSPALGLVIHFKATLQGTLISPLPGH